MGLMASVYRPARLGDCSNGGPSSKADFIVVVNMSGPFEPDEKMPGFEMVPNAIGGGYHLEPVGPKPENCAGPMYGGNLASSSDSRFRAPGGKRIDALRIHDRYESWEMYERMSR